MGCLQWSTLETKDCTINTLRFWNIAIARREVHSKRKFFLVRFPSFWKPLIFQLQLPPRHRLKAARFQRKFWRKFNGLLNASQTFYSDNGSQRAPPLRFERRKGWWPETEDGWGLVGGVAEGGVAVACSFLGRSKRCGRTCRFHAAKRLGPDFDLPRDFVPRPRAVVARQTSACLNGSFEQQQWLETEIKTRMRSPNTNFYFRLSYYRTMR